jgi:LmbE family N-acetylglucosaminyl deacetylase
MTHWFFSPHPDDAALSCGGQIATLTRGGEPCTIVTVMGGDPPPEMTVTPFVEELWKRWNIGRGAAVTQARREEDTQAAAALGADIKFLDYPDAVYRPYYPDLKAIFGTPAFPDMLGLFNQLAQDITNERKLPIRAGDTVHLPLGVGGHVDHLIVGALGSALKKLKSVVYYEDYPYSRDRSLIETTLHQRSRTGGTPIVYPLDNAALDAKIMAVACYRSQLNSFWADDTAMAAGIRDYTREVGGEREWVLTAANRTNEQ